jgi:hypothetical protein
MNSLIAGIVKEISKMTGCSLYEAFNRLYSSEFFKYITNVELGLYYRGQTNLAYIFVNDLFDEV